MTSIWNDELIVRLKGLWAQGLSAQQIADQMGLSRNTVIGKAFRLKRDKEIIGRNRPKASSVRYIRAKSRKKLVVVELVNEPPPVGGVAYMDLTKETCHAFISGKDRDGLPLSCGGHTVRGTVYCAYHCGLFYVPPKSRRVNISRRSYG